MFLAELSAWGASIHWGGALQKVPVKWGKTAYGRIFSKTLEEHGEMWFILTLLIV